MVRRVDFVGSGYECVRFVFVDTETVPDALVAAERWYKETGQDFHYIGMEIPKEYAFNPTMVEAMHFTVKEDGVVVGACCNVNEDTGEVFGFCNEVDFVLDKPDTSARPGDEYIVLQDRKFSDGSLQRIPVVLADERTFNCFYWRQPRQEDEKAVDAVLNDAKERCTSCIQRGCMREEQVKE